MGEVFNNRSLVGGSVANLEGGNIAVNGKTQLIIKLDNTDAAMTISSNLYGGSWAVKGTVIQNGDASMIIDATNGSLNLRGNIYVSGGSVNGSLTMLGNSYITFTGNTSNLTFTGSVNAIESEKDEVVIFDDYLGIFNGSLRGFDEMLLKGGTALSLGRKQSDCSRTKVVIDLSERSSDKAQNACYTVRDKNAWDFASDIDIRTAGCGPFVLIDNTALNLLSYIKINGQNLELSEDGLSGSAGGYIVHFDNVSNNYTLSCQ